MPIYEYECSSCHEHFENMQKISDAQLEICKCCGAEKTLKKLVSNTSFHLKGGGWYKDLYSSNKSSDSSSSTTAKAAQKPADSTAPVAAEKTAKTPDKAA